jgi:hypothetical protein
LDGVYNVQNDRIWAVSREETDKQGDVHQKTKFPTKVMTWIGVCGEGLTEPVIIEDGTMDAKGYISDVLSIALKCSKKCWETTGLTSMMVLDPTYIVSLKNGVLIIFLNLSRNIIGDQIRLIYAR